MDNYLIDLFGKSPVQEYMKGALQGNEYIDNQRAAQARDQYASGGKQALGALSAYDPQGYGQMQAGRVHQQAAVDAEMLNEARLVQGAYAAMKTAKDETARASIYNTYKDLAVRSGMELPDDPDLQSYTPNTFTKLGELNSSVAGFLTDPRGSSNLPSAVQVANEIQAALAVGDYERANLIAWAQKMHDKGVQPYGGNVPAPSFSKPEPAPVADTSLPEIESEEVITPVAPVPTSGTKQPLPAVTTQIDGNETLDTLAVDNFNPEVPPLAIPSMSQMSPAEIPGYGKVVASMAGEKARAEEEAKQQEELKYAKDIAEAKARGEIAPKKEAMKIEQTKVTKNVTEVLDIYNKLDELGAVPSVKRSTGENLRISASVTGVGQFLDKKVAGEAQSLRNQIAAIKPTLMSAIRQATEMGAKGLDSEKELEFYMAALSDPTQDVESSKAALKILNDNYGLGIDIDISPEYVAGLKKKYESSLGGKGKASSPSGKPEVGTTITAPDGRKGVVLPNGKIRIVE